MKEFNLIQTIIVSGIVAYMFFLLSHEIKQVIKLIKKG
jgi:hypothetical protein